jgi:hypothetical protein
VGKVRLPVEQAPYKHFLCHVGAARHMAVRTKKKVFAAGGYRHSHETAPLMCITTRSRILLVQSTKASKEVSRWHQTAIQLSNYPM